MAAPGQKLDAGVTELKSGRWVKFFTRDYVANDGTKIQYECFSRVKRGEVYADGVDVLAVDKSDDSILLVEQYRAPVNKTCVEMPAGLIDFGESAAVSAVRELREETGHVASDPANVQVTPVFYADPSLTDDSTCVATVEFDAAKGKSNALEAGDEITLVRKVRLAELKDVLDEYAAKGYAVDAKVYMFALGYDMALKSRKL